MRTHVQDPRGIPAVGCGLRTAGSGFGLKIVAVVALSVASFVAIPAIGSSGSIVASGDPVIAAAGDIACDPLDASFNGGKGTVNACEQQATANLLVGHGYTAVLPLGDNQYYCGSLAAFDASYDKSWGQVKSISHPVPGIHEYVTTGSSRGATGCDSSNANAAGYFDYFGAAAGTPGQGWYSYDIGAWHLIALNTQCGEVGGCSATSPQGKWLAADLAAHPNQCTLAYWHIPLFSSGGYGNGNSLPFWQMLYAAGADIVLGGNAHIYERFSPQNPNGAPDPNNGITQFTVGTGGGDHTGLSTPTAANSVVRNTSSFGVLALTLHQSSYSWTFIPATGSLTDSGSASCHHGTTSTTSSASRTASTTPAATAAPTASSRRSVAPAPTSGTLGTAASPPGTPWPLILLLIPLAVVLSVLAVRRVLGQAGRRFLPKRRHS